MKKKLFPSLVFAFAAVLFSANAIEQPALPKEKKVKINEIKKVKNTAFTYGEKLEYRVHYGPLTGGNASFEIDPNSVDVNGRKSYHIKVSGKSAGMVDVMFKVRDEFESYVDEEAIIPWKCIKRVKEGGYKDSDFIMFDQVNGFATSRRGKVDIEQQTQDVVSAIYFARTTDMTNAKVGDIFPVNFYIDAENYLLRFKYVGKEVVKTDAGTFNTLVIKPQLIKGRVFKDDEALTLWVTDDDNKLPIMVESDIFVGSIKAELIKYDKVKNPLTSKIK
ncbi:MAG: hypothetical protein CFE21_16725 [Bacteroidetes bacterium B1(2017)]|nr:MAG: hypothetical protein CFE21_16725 [Bacteroidetes bacterium B1(2017)]